MLVRPTIAAVLVLFASAACRLSEPDPLVVLVGLDGASLDLVDELRAQGKLPSFDRLIRTGASGPLQSWASRRLFSDNQRRDFWSPIVWTSIATGKIPEKHGVRDFVLPVPGSSSVWVSGGTGGRAVVRLPEIRKRTSLRLVLRLRARSRQRVAVSLNGTPLETLDVSDEWTDLSATVPGDVLAPVRNELELVFSRPRGARIAELGFLRIVDPDGLAVFELDPAFAGEQLASGFLPPSGRLVEAQSIHWRAKPVWSVMSELGIPVGIIGYWGTWPAYPVNGFLVTSRMGIREQRQGSDRLTWPDALATELEPRAPTVDELAATFDTLHVSACDPPLIDRQSVLKKILLQDEYYVRMTRELLPTMKSGLFAVYLRSIDVAAHPTFHWRYGADIPESCPESVREIVDETYVQIDRWLGEIVDALPTRATIVLVSDHGMRPIEGGGHHAAFGLIVANGDGVRRGDTFHGSTVLDVAPTLLHLAGAPVPLELDGKVLAPMFESVWLSSHAPRYVEMDTTLEGDSAVVTDASEDALEQLKALGYIQ